MTCCTPLLLTEKRMSDVDLHSSAFHMFMVCLRPCRPACLIACNCRPACGHPCLRAYVPTRLRACLPACLPAYLPRCLHACLPACLPVHAGAGAPHVSRHVSICTSRCLLPFFCMCACVRVRLCFKFQCMHEQGDCCNFCSAPGT